MPEPVQLATEKQSFFQRLTTALLGLCGEPVDCCQLIGIVLAHREGCRHLPLIPEGRCHACSELHEEVGVSIAHPLHLAPGMKLLSGKGANGLQQRITPALGRHTDQAFFHQRLQFIQGTDAIRLVIADLLQGFECPALVKDRAATQQLLLIRFQE